MPRRKPVTLKADGSYALALSGGGAAGAWLPGAGSALYEVHKIRDFPIVYGTSTGSLYAILVALYQTTGDPQWLYEGEEVYRSVNDADILSFRTGIARCFGDDAELFGLAASIVKGENSVFDVTPLRELVDRFVADDDWEELIESDEVELGFTCYDMQDDCVVTFRNNDPGMTVAKFKEALIASSSQPVLMPPVLIDGHQYIDGGLGAVTPTEEIYDSIEDLDRVDIDGVISLDLEHYGPSPKTEMFEKNTDILLRTIEILAGRVYDTNVDETTLKNKCTPRVPNYRFRPDPPATIGSLNFDTDEMNDLVRQGFKNMSRWVKVDRS